MSDHAAVEHALRELRAAWHGTAEGWRDRARDEFARHHLDPIETRTREAARTLGALAALLDEARRQCR